MNTYSRMLEECESDLRAGQAQRIEARLGGLKLARLPREACLPFANIARRAGFFVLGLKFLSSAVRPEMNPSPHELAEFAVLLQKIGAMEEAQIYLEQVNKSLVPQAYLYQAFHHFHEWNGPAAIPCLEDYLRADLSAYERAVARVNLAAALILSERRDEAAKLLSEAVESNRQAGFVRLAGNCHEMLAQLLIHRMDFREAEAELDRAATLFGQERTQDAFFVRKWRAALAAIDSGLAAPLLDLQAEARELKDWETIREVDLFLLKLAFEQKRFDHLYFGTPFAAYRARATRWLGREPSGNEYFYGAGVDAADGAGNPLATQFDLESGRIEGAGRGGQSVIEPGSKLHQLLATLLRDLYRPQRAAGIFACLFADEHFDPFTSVDRVYRLIARARHALAKARLPIEITHQGEGFLVTFSGPVQIRLTLDSSPVERNQVLLAKLRNAFPSYDFNSRQATEILGLSASAFKRLAARSIAAGEMEKVGAGAGTFYRLVSTGRRERIAG